MKKTIILITLLLTFLIGTSTTTFAATDEHIEVFLGTYRGWYYANQGHTGLTLNVYVNENGEYEASFNFYSVPENPSVPSGEYICSVQYNATDNSYYVEGLKWIKRPSNYVFVDLDGILENNIYSGNVITSSKTFKFELVKQIGDNATSNWADDTVNTAIIESYVPLELQSNYQSKITRADFSRLTIAAISLKTGKSIEAFMADKNTDIIENPFDDTDDIFVTYANSLGILSGYGNRKFGPNDPITREQAACMLMSLAGVLDVDITQAQIIPFNDRSTFSSWALKGINFTSSFKDSNTSAPIMSGYNNQFKPKDGYTREQAIITIYKLIKAIN